MSEGPTSVFDPARESNAEGYTAEAREEELMKFRRHVARVIGPFAEMAELLSPVDPRGTVIERGNKVLEVRHFHNLKALFESLAD